MVKAKLLKELRKKINKAERLENPLLSVVEDKDQILSIKVVQSGDDPSNNSNDGGAHSQKLSIQYCPASDLTDDLMNQCLDLFEQNMGDIYRKSSWGLDMQKKAEELQHRKASFLLALGSDENNQQHVVAFCHFRFDYDDEEEPECCVLYLYEIQVQPPFHGKGIGRQFMTWLEAMARRVEMKKVMLTVFKANDRALQFYRETLDYDIDESSPSRHDEPADFEILSKVV